MNPFELSDSLFFFAYVALIATVVLVVRWLRRSQEQVSTPTLHDVDPYAIAVLRAGSNGAVQLALANATQRGTLVHEGFKLRAVPGTRSTHALEQTLIDALQTPVSVTDVVRLPALVTLLDGYQRQLEAQGLLPDAARREQRQMLWRGGLGLLWLIAGIRIAGNLSHGEPIAFDVVTLALLALPLVRMAANARRTWAGDRVLNDLIQRVRQHRPSLTGSDPWGPDQLLAGAVLGLSGVAIGRRIKNDKRRENESGSGPSGHDAHSSSNTSGDGDERDHDNDSDSNQGESSCGGDGGGEGGCGSDGGD